MSSPTAKLQRCLVIVASLALAGPVAASGPGAPRGCSIHFSCASCATAADPAPGAACLCTSACGSDAAECQCDTPGDGCQVRSERTPRDREVDLVLSGADLTLAELALLIECQHGWRATVNGSGRVRAASYSGTLEQVLVAVGRAAGCAVKFDEGQGRVTFLGP